jgi:hypothetical protein
VPACNPDGSHSAESSSAERLSLRSGDAYAVRGRTESTRGHRRRRQGIGRAASAQPPRFTTPLRRFGLREGSPAPDLEQRRQPRRIRSQNSSRKEKWATLSECDRYLCSGPRPRCRSRRTVRADSRHPRPGELPTRRLSADQSATSPRRTSDRIYTILLPLARHDGRAHGCFRA